MEVRLTPELEAEVNRIAASAGYKASDFVVDLVERYVKDEKHFREAVQRRIDEADRGEFVAEEEMDARIERMFRS